MKMMEYFTTTIYMEHYKVSQVFISHGWDPQKKELIYEKVYG